jgi:phosphoenolpyruvate carboxylase
VTAHLGLGSYKEWDEEQRLEWLATELGSKRPLIPASMPFTPESKEVMATMR